MDDQEMIHGDKPILSLKGRHGWVVARPDFHRLSGPLLNISTPVGGAALTPGEAREFRDSLTEWLDAFARVEREDSFG